MQVLFAIGPSGVLLAFAPTSTQADDVPLHAPFTPTGTWREVHPGADGQSDPPISGGWGSYTAQPTYNVRNNVIHPSPRGEMNPNNSQPKEYQNASD